MSVIGIYEPRNMDPHGPTWVHEPVNCHDILADFGHHSTPQKLVIASQRMAIIYVHNLKTEQEDIRRRIQTHIRIDPEG